MLNFFNKLSTYFDNDLSAFSRQVENFPVSLIIGEHPSEYAVSPKLWNTEYELRGADEIFLPVDMKADDSNRLETFLRFALGVGREHFRVLTITNPFKVRAFEYFFNSDDSRLAISEDARSIKATNQILVGPDDVFHVINSDGRGLANSVESFLSQKGQGDLAGKQVGMIGAGGAARGIIYELAKRISQVTGGSLTVFNRTVDKAEELVREINTYFPGLTMSAKGLPDLKTLAAKNDLLVLSITQGDPLLEQDVYQTLPKKMLIVDVNYGANSVAAKNAASVGRDDLDIHDGSGMVVEGYIIPSQELAKLWGYRVEPEVYSQIAKQFNYQPKQ